MAKVSIVVPAYNRAHIIAKTLDSFIAQTYQEWDCYVVDDHSTDNTAEVVNFYCNKDNRIKYLVNNRKKGAQGARNTGIIASDAEWICIFDSDDCMRPLYLEKLIARTSENVGVVSCWCNKISIIDGTTKILKWGGDGSITKQLVQGVTYVGYDSALIRKQSLLDIGLLDENIKAYQEFDTHIRLSLIARYSCVPEALFDYYVGAVDTISTQSELDKTIKYAKIILKHRWLWRKYRYLVMLYYLSSLFLSNKLSSRLDIVKIAPDVLLAIPFYVIAKYTRKLFNQ